jgi:hypothetical protein
MRKHKRAAARGRRGALPLAHGLFMSAAGLWPLLHLRSFEAVTGPKRDKWLVRSVGAVLTSIGAALVADGLHGGRSDAIRVLGIGSAVALGGADVVYTAKGCLSKVYLLDAAVQAGFCSLWLGRGR